MPSTRRRQHAAESQRLRSHHPRHNPTRTTGINPCISSRTSSPLSGSVRGRTSCTSNTTSNTTFYPNLCPTRRVWNLRTNHDVRTPTYDNPHDGTATTTVWPAATATPRTRWGGEAGEAGTQDVEHTGTKKGLHMHANLQHSPINKDMERHKHEGSKDMEAGGATTRKHTGSTTTIGTCVTRVVLMCHGDTQARHAHKHAAGLDIRKIVTGELQELRGSRTQCLPQKGRHIYLAHQPGATPSLTNRGGN